jgi:hypothetical protein
VFAYIFLYLNAERALKKLLSYENNKNEKIKLDILE